MASPRIARADALVSLLTGAGIQAARRSGGFRGLLPAVLVQPPRVDWVLGGYGGPVVTWRLLAVSSSSDPDTAWAQLDALLDDVADVLSVENADPAVWQESATDAPLPAYVLTYSENVEE